MSTALTPDLRDALIAELEARTTSPGFHYLDADHLSELSAIESTGAPVLSLFMALSPEMRVSDVWQTTYKDLARHALDKLRRKKCDLLVANDVSRREIGFDRDDNEVTLFFPDGTREELPRAPKRVLADLLIARIVSLPKQERQEMDRQEGPPAA